MPELPEVETIARNLRTGTAHSRSILGLRIETAEIRWERSLAQPGLPEFMGRTPGQAVQSIGRRGKFLLMGLTSDTLVIHLRMSGDLLVLDDPAAEAPRHARMIVCFIPGVRLVFNDPRKFGRIWLVDDPGQVTGDLGPEPFDPELTEQAFFSRIHPTRRQLKPLLLDQHFLAGLGNIYTDEALHLAGLHPLRLSGSLSRDEAARLLASIRTVLQQGIEQNGASIDWVYRGGDFQNHFRAYGRTGEPCPVCGTSIGHLKVGQRSTHICPSCQPLIGE